MRFAKILIPLLFILLTSILTGCCTNIQHPTVPQIAKSANNDTVALIADFSEQPFCTGVWVSQSVILTANHCVEGYASMLHIVAVMKALKEDGCPDFLIPLFAKMDPDTLAALAEEDPIAQHVLEIVMSVPPVSPDNLEIPYTIQSKVVDNGVKPTVIYHSITETRAPKEDLAILRIDKTERLEEHGVVELANETPEVGESVYSTGQSMGGYWNFKNGVVSAYRNDMSHVGMKKFHGPFMQTTVIMSPGDSGGGVFNSDGKLVGIASFIEQEAHFSFCIHLETIRGFLIGQHLLNANINPIAPDPDLE